MVHDRRRLEEGLGRDASAQEARPSQTVVAFDQRDALPELGGPKGGGVSARPAAQHDDVIPGVGHPFFVPFGSWGPRKPGGGRSPGPAKRRSPSHSARWSYYAGVGERRAKHRWS